MTIHSQQSYLQKHRFAPRQIQTPPHPQLGLVVVIPCHMEHQLSQTLDSLNACSPPKTRVEIIIVFNSSEKTPNSVITYHNKQIEQIQGCQEQKTPFPYHCLHFPQLRPKHAGVGLARKIGMDEAVDRLEQAGSPDGIIVCLDGDTLVENNYLQEIEQHFHARPKAEACSIYFEHPLSGGEFEAEIYQGIQNYELFLRFYIEGLRYAGYPYAYHTIGSAMAIRSRAYQARGGMNRRKAGEDFYFLHKFIPQGGFSELCSTRVIPSPRPSNRVPFGTGKAIQDWLNGDHAVFSAYDPRIFAELKVLLESVPEYYLHYPTHLPPSVQAWSEVHRLSEQLEKIRANVGQAASFPKRFYQWLDALKVLQFVHFARDNFYPDLAVEESAARLLLMKGFKTEKEGEGLLMKFREMQKIPWYL